MQSCKIGCVSNLMNSTGLGKNRKAKLTLLCNYHRTTQLTTLQFTYFSLVCNYTAVILCSDFNCSRHGRSEIGNAFDICIAMLRACLNRFVVS
jgi:hypothetical protein